MNLRIRLYNSFAINDCLCLFSKDQWHWVCHVVWPSQILNPCLFQKNLSFSFFFWKTFFQLLECPSHSFIRRKKLNIYVTMYIISALDSITTSARFGWKGPFDVSRSPSQQSLIYLGCVLWLLLLLGMLTNMLLKNTLEHETPYCYAYLYITEGHHTWQSRS